MDESTIVRAARAIALHAAGATWQAAGAQVADGVTRGRDDGAQTSPSTIGVYRKRVRDRRP
jgi:hypothetical protein